MNALKAYVFGLTIALAIGPIALLILSNGLRFGAAAGLKSALGAALADFSYGIAALLLGQTAVRFLAAHETGFQLFSSLVLALFGLWMVHGAVRIIPGHEPHEAKNGGRPGGSGVLGTFLLTIVNPLTTIAFLGFTGQLRLSGAWWEAPVLAAAIGAGSFTVAALMALFAAALSPWLHKPAILRRLNLASGLAIAGFGFFGAWPVIRSGL
ncbi:MAG: LysE family transporter [Gammaproteobacteria bacterium]|nr:LysE family transporter [Gammaproteobacteria bacterium]